MSDEGCACDCHRAADLLPHKRSCCTWPTTKVLSVPQELLSTSVPVFDPTLQKQALGAVKEWAEAVAIARKELVNAVHDALDAGCSQASVGTAAGMTGSGAALMAKRNPRSSYRR